MKSKILIVDDNVKLCESLKDNFEDVGINSYYATCKRDALKLLLKYKMAAVILDVRLGDEDGLEVLKRILSIDSNIRVIMLTAYGTFESAVKSIKIGAYDYIQKPVNFDHLLKVTENAIAIAKLQIENDLLRDRLIDSSNQIITNDEKMLSLLSKAKRLSGTDLPILIRGESGTGKELIADLLHNPSSRCTQDAIKINCASFPESLLDNELFGHEEGAYTGATSRYRGVFEQANHSSLFLDEIGNMPLTIQTKILRVIQNQELRRLGGKGTIKVNVRFITASNKSIKRLINEKLFREDLFYRLNSAKLVLPPLRERKDDIPLLIDFFLNTFSKEYSVERKTVNPKVLQELMEYEWPGNVRELKSCIHYASAVSLNNEINIDDLPPEFNDSGNNGDRVYTRESMEETMIIQALKRSKGNKKRAAEMLQISRKTLYNKLAKYHIGKNNG